VTAREATAQEGGSRLSGEARGVLAVVVASVAWSTAGLAQRGLEVSPATQVAGRAAFAAIALFVLLVVLERGRIWVSLATMGVAGLGFAACTAVASGLFVLALNYTTVANVLFMQALAPLLAALVARVFLGEAVSPRTWSAMAIAMAGVALMVGGPDRSSAAGIVLPIVMTASFAVAIVIARHRRDVSMVPGTFVSQVLVVAVAAPFASAAGVSADDVTLLAFLGIFQIGLGLGLLTVAARLIPPAEVALISLLEVVLGPLWVWLAYDEQPGASTVAGGVIVLAAVAVQALGDLRPSWARRSG
jgi:drug/metabolite transporter (DMT)-like permease